MEPDQILSVPDNLDHLIYTTSNLESGIDKIENLLGVRPVIGGRHPDFGTHNALLSIGNSSYLEIVAPDYSLPSPESGRFMQQFFNQPPKLASWALKTNDIHRLSEAARKNGLNTGLVQQGSRTTPEGQILNWQLTDPFALHFGGSIPFLIDWGDTTHPSTVVPKAGKLIEFQIEHPKADEMKANLQLLNINMNVKPGKVIKLTAWIETQKGIVEL